MHPEYAAYKISAHSHVACVDCHIGSGFSSYFAAKVNGTRQLIEVSFHPIAGIAPKINSGLPNTDSVASAEPAPGAARFAKAATRRRDSLARNCWSNPALPTTSRTVKRKTVVVLHLGGQDSLSHLTGIHGVHLGHIEYIAIDPTRTTIPWVQRR